jgi:hypothetical protein
MGGCICLGNGMGIGEDIGIVGIGIEGSGIVIDVKGEIGIGAWTWVLYGCTCWLVLSCEGEYIRHSGRLAWGVVLQYCSVSMGQCVLVRVLVCLQ